MPALSVMSRLNHMTEQDSIWGGAKNLPRYDDVFSEVGVQFFSMVSLSKYSSIGEMMPLYAKLQTLGPSARMMSVGALAAAFAWIFGNSSANGSSSKSTSISGWVFWY